MTALEKPTRRKIFYSMAALFVLLVPLVLLYSRGYIVDFRGRSLVATGGIFVKTVQPRTMVFVDSEFRRETSFISHGMLITDLLPKRYAVRIEKEGFQKWEKVVRVPSEEVLEFRDVFLPPATITPTAIFSTRRSVPSRAQVLKGRQELGLEVGDPTRSVNVFVVNPQTRSSRLNLVGVSRWFWDSNSKAFIIGRKSEGRMLWYRLADVADAKEELIAFRGLPAGFSAESVEPHPSNPNELYFFAGGALFLQGRASVPIPIAEQVHSYVITAENIYFLSKNGFFVESDLEGGNSKVLGRKGLFLNEEAPARIIASPAGDAAVLDSASGLFIYRRNTDVELEFVAGNVAGIDFSAAGDRLLFWDEHRLWLYWLKDNPRQPFDLAKTARQIFFSEDKIQRAFLNTGGTYAFFATDNIIRMVEVDTRGSVNAYDLVRSLIQSFALDKDNLNLYWTKDSVMYRAILK